MVYLKPKQLIIDCARRFVLTYTDTKHRAASLRQQSFLYNFIFLTLGGAHVAQSMFSESNSRRICHSTSTSTLLVLSAFFNYDKQLRRIRRSLDDDSVATLVHAFVVSRVDYCGSLLIGAPRKSTDKLQRVLNSAARIVSNTCQFYRGLIHLRRSQLHWLDVVDRVRFRVCVQV